MIQSEKTKTGREMSEEVDPEVEKEKEADPEVRKEGREADHVALREERSEEGQEAEIEGESEVKATRDRR